MIRRLIAVVALVLITAACTAGAVPPPNKPPPPMSRPLAQEGQMCAGITGIACASGLACQVPPEQCRTIADASGVCRKPPQACTREYAPICGCDGKTYGNACTAAAAGASVAAQGACSAS